MCAFAAGGRGFLAEGCVESLLRLRREPNPSHTPGVDIAAVVVIVLMVALAAGLVLLFRRRACVMNHHAISMTCLSWSPRTR